MNKISIVFSVQLHRTRVGLSVWEFSKALCLYHITVLLCFIECALWRMMIPSFKQKLYQIPGRENEVSHSFERKKKNELFDKC